MHVLSNCGQMARAMSVHISTCWPGFMLVLLLLAPGCCTEDLSVRTIEVSQEQCGKTFEVGASGTGKIDVYRILMQKGGICPPDSFFACSIYFRFQKSADSDIDKKKEVCVDFSRIRLYGENTTLSISDGIHLDGTCKRRRNAMYSPLQMVIRSFLWKDTAEEEKIQNCSLDLSTSHMFSLYDSFTLCIEWKFYHTPCGVSLTWGRQTVWARFDYSRSESFTCHRAGQTAVNHKGMNDCTSYSVLNDRFFEVSRNTAQMDDGSVEDGLLYFEIRWKLEKDKDHDYDEDNSDEDDTVDDDVSASRSFGGRTFWKFFWPICAVFGICAGFCSITQRKRQRRQLDETDAEVDDEMPMPPGEPLVGPTGEATYQSYTTTSQPRYSSDESQSDGSAENMTAAPPPAYGDVAHVTPSSQRTSFDAEIEPSAPAVEDSSLDIPPPSVTSQPSSAPPAYHELFPSHT